MLKNKNLDFYDEVLKTLWGYASDKLNLPVESLSRDNIREQFSKINVPFEVLITTFLLLTNVNMSAMLLVTRKVI